MSAPSTTVQPSRGFEAFIFFVLSVFIWPFIAIGAVGAYGFGIWALQILSAGH